MGMQPTGWMTENYDQSAGAICRAPSRIPSRPCLSDKLYSNGPWTLLPLSETLGGSPSGAALALAKLKVEVKHPSRLAFR